MFDTVFSNIEGCEVTEDALAVYMSESETFPASTEDLWNFIENHAGGGAGGSN